MVKSTPLAVHSHWTRVLGLWLSMSAKGSRQQLLVALESASEESCGDVDTVAEAISGQHYWQPDGARGA